MKNIKELLILLKNHIQELPADKDHSMCFNVFRIKKIILDDSFKLEEFLKENKPFDKNINKHWWHPQDKENRINWLNGQINKL